MSAILINDFKFHDWWIQKERDPSAPPKQFVQLFISKEPIATDLRIGFELCTRIVLSISIKKNGKPHSFVTMKSNVDGVIKVNYTLMPSNMLHLLSRTSKAKDILDNLVIIATWWNKISSYEQRRHEVMSKQRKKILVEQHRSMEKLYALAQVSPRQFGQPTM
jgi:hypothetical protein